MISDVYVYFRSLRDDQGDLSNMSDVTTNIAMSVDLYNASRDSMDSYTAGLEEVILLSFTGAKRFGLAFGRGAFRILLEIAVARCQSNFHRDSEFELAACWEMTVL